MKKITLALAAVLAVFMLMACTTTYTVPVDATGNTSSKVGEVSETVKHFLMFPLNYTVDVPAYKAAQNGGISKIATVDYRVSTKQGIFGPVVTYTTIVTGE